MSGVAGKSGPPGNSNAAGNSGGKAGRSGPPGHANASTHGIGTFGHTGKLPKGCGWLSLRQRSGQRALEAAVLKERGTIDLTDAGLIQSCMRHEVIAQLALRHLRRAEGGKVAALSFEQTSAIWATISKATNQRDACIKRLGLKRETGDPMAFLRQPVALADPETEQRAVSGDSGFADSARTPCEVFTAGGAESSGVAE